MKYVVNTYSNRIFEKKKIQNLQVGADVHLFQLQYKYKKWLDKTRVFKNQTGFDENKQNVSCGGLMGKYLNPPQKYCKYLLGGEIISSFKLIF